MNFTQTGKKHFSNYTPKPVNVIFSREICAKDCRVCIMQKYKIVTVRVNVVLVEAGESGRTAFLVMHVGVDLKMSGIKHRRKY